MDVSWCFFACLFSFKGSRLFKASIPLPRTHHKCMASPSVGNDSAGNFYGPNQPDHQFPLSSGHVPRSMHLLNFSNIGLVQWHYTWVFLNTHQVHPSWRTKWTAWSPWPPNTCFNLHHPVTTMVSEHWCEGSIIRRIIPKTMSILMLTIRFHVPKKLYTQNNKNE